VLGIYTFTKRVNLDDGEAKPRRAQGYSTVSHFNVIHIECHLAAVRWLYWLRWCLWAVPNHRDSSVWGRHIWTTPSKRIIAHFTLIPEVAALLANAVARLMSISSDVVSATKSRQVFFMRLMALVRQMSHHSRHTRHSWVGVNYNNLCTQSYHSLPRSAFCLYPVVCIRRNKYFISVCLAIVWSLRYHLALRDQI